MYNPETPIGPFMIEVVRDSNFIKNWESKLISKFNNLSSIMSKLKAKRKSRSAISKAQQESAYPSNQFDRGFTISNRIFIT